MCNHKIVNNCHDYEALRLYPRFQTRYAIDQCLTYKYIMTVMVVPTLTHIYVSFGHC